jgi:hypothetical protein
LRLSPHTKERKTAANPLPILQISIEGLKEEGMDHSAGSRKKL